MWLFCLKIDWSHHQNSSFALTDRKWIDGFSSACDWPQQFTSIEADGPLRVQCRKWFWPGKKVWVAWQEQKHTHTHRQMCDAADVLISQLSPPQGQRAAPALVFVYSTQTEMRLLWAVGSDLGTGTFACSSPRMSQRLFFFSFKAIGSFFLTNRPLSISWTPPYNTEW